MVYEMMPVIEADKLEEALWLQYGNAFMEEVGDIRNFLFPSDYMNDCYKSLYIEDCGKSHLHNCIYTYLQDVMPKGTKVVLIDVSW